MCEMCEMCGKQYGECKGLKVYLMAQETFVGYNLW